MFFIFGTTFLLILSITLVMLWGHEKLSLRKVVPRARIEEYWDGEERRKHLRFRNEIEVEYAIEKKPHLKSSFTIDISKGGMRLKLDEKLSSGTIMDIKIRTSAKQLIEIEAEVVWTKAIDGTDPLGRRFFHSGVKFIGIKEPSGIHLNNYLNALKSEIKEGP